MNIVDLIIILILAAGVLTGLRQGLILELAFIVGVFVALFVAKAGYKPVRSLIDGAIHQASWRTTASYLIVFVVVWAAIIALARGIRRAMRLLMMGWLDRLGGAVLGFFQAAVVVEMLLYLGKKIPASQANELHKLVTHSTLAPTFLDLIPAIHRLFPSVLR
jgi:membrane protein required for colicin V production